MYQGRRFYKQVIKYPAFNHKREFLGYFNNQEEVKNFLKTTTVISSVMVLTKCIGFKEDVGFIRQFLIIPTVLTYEKN